MVDTTYNAQAFESAAPAANNSMWLSLWMTTPLYIFVSAIKSALQTRQR